MKDFNLAPVILLIVLVLLPLVNYILKRMARRFEHPTPERQPMPDMGFRRQAAPTSASRDSREPAHTLPPTEAMTQRAVGGSRRALFRTRRDMRRAIIAMTVLGPCRANEPPD